MSTTVTSTAEPTLGHYQCGSGCSPLSFRWTKTMPQNGWLGEVTFGQYVNKPIQVFDMHVVRDGEGRELFRDWAFQAQDGSFLGRVYVSRLKSHIRFTKFRANDQWPQITCSIPITDPRDPREPIDRAQ